MGSKQQSHAVALALTPDRGRWIAICCAIVIAALYVVGVASGTVLRHAIQTGPLWACVLLGWKRTRGVRWLALPMLVFWLVIMVLIWSFLLGWSRLASGHYSPVEIAMTLVVGAAALLGIPASLCGDGKGSAAAALGWFLVGAVLQYAAFYISFLPAIARR